MTLVLPFPVMIKRVMPIYMPCPSTVKQHTHTPNLIHPPNLFSAFFFFVLLILLIFSLSSFLPLLFLSVTTIYLSRCPHQLFFLSHSHFSLPDPFPSPLFPPHYISTHSLIYACIIYLFFTYSFTSLFFCGETHFSLSLSLALALSGSRYQCEWLCNPAAC